AMVKRVKGVVRVGLGPKGFIEKLDPDTMPPAAARLPEKLRDLGLPLTVAGDKAAALVREKGDGKYKVVLKRWDLKTGKAEAPLTLWEGGGYPIWRITLDGGHGHLGSLNGVSAGGVGF